MNLKNITYTDPFGTKFIFEKDIKELLPLPKFKKWQEKSRGSTCLLLPDGNIGIYPYDLEKFIRLDKRGL